MTPLLRRAAACAGIAACGWSTLLAAQSTEVAVPERQVLRQAVKPGAPGPIIQQSPNGLYKLSISDAGIELHGPKGTVKIGEYGIQIGGPGTMQINIESGDGLRLRGDRDARFLSGATMTLKAGGDMDVAGANMKVNGSAAVTISGAAPSSLTAPLLTLGCAGGRMAARQGDQLAVGGNTGVIVAGSPRVFVC